MTYVVYQKSKQRWVAVGSFESEETDSISLRELLRVWLWNNGILQPNMDRFAAEPMKGGAQ